jgi:hypothetical protein
MKKKYVAALTMMGALALLLAPPASAAFDKAGYLRCMASDAMSVGGIALDSSSAAKIGAEAYAAVGGQSQTTSVQESEAKALAKEHQIPEAVAALIVQCAQGSQA